MVFSIEELMLISRALVIYGNAMRDRVDEETSPQIAEAVRLEAVAAVRLRQRIVTRQEPPRHPLSVFTPDYDPPPAA